MIKSVTITYEFPITRSIRFPYNCNINNVETTFKRLNDWSATTEKEKEIYIRILNLLKHAKHYNASLYKINIEYSNKKYLLQISLSFSNFEIAKEFNKKEM